MLFSRRGLARLDRERGKNSKRQRVQTPNKGKISKFKQGGDSKSPRAKGQTDEEADRVGGVDRGRNGPAGRAKILL